MAKTLTQKQEHFCQAYIETGNASEAYRQSYNAENMKPESIHRKACELMENGKVTARIIQLQEAHRNQHSVTVEAYAPNWTKPARWRLMKTRPVQQ